MSMQALRAYVITALLLFAAITRADEPRSTSTPKEPTLLDRWNAAVEEAARRTGAIKTYGQPRKVLKGAKPEIILRDDTIEYDGKPLKLGQSLHDWRRVLPVNPRCLHEPHEAVCTWDNLGLQVVTAKPPLEHVAAFVIFIQPVVKDPSNDLMTHLPNGEPIKKLPDMKPAKPFPGYLELDDFGIDAKTKFWELRRSADKKRDLRCDIDGCEHPHGGFGDHGSIYIKLNGRTEDDVLRRFAVGS